MKIRRYKSTFTHKQHEALLYTAHAALITVKCMDKVRWDDSFNSTDILHLNTDQTGERVSLAALLH